MVDNLSAYIKWSFGTLASKISFEGHHTFSFTVRKDVKAKEIYDTIAEYYRSRKLVAQRSKASFEVLIRRPEDCRLGTFEFTQIGRMRCRAGWRYTITTMAIEITPPTTHSSRLSLYCPA